MIPTTFRVVLTDRAHVSGCSRASSKPRYTNSENVRAARDILVGRIGLYIIGEGAEKHGGSSMGTRAMTARPSALVSSAEAVKIVSWPVINAPGVASTEVRCPSAVALNMHRYFLDGTLDTP